MIHRQPIASLIKRLNDIDETSDLEAKEQSDTTVSRSVYETICALSNEPDLEGGTILLGVEKELSLFPGYTAKGVTDPDKLSADIASGCASMFNQPVRVAISCELVGDRPILKIDVPELPAGQKPLYLAAVGLPKGAYRRIGTADIRCTDEDLFTFFHGNDNGAYDLRIVSDATWDDIDPVSIAAYRRSRAEANPDAEELHWSDEEMLYSLSAIKRVDGKIRITHAGLLTFGKAAAIRRLYPAHRVDYIRVPGTAWVDNPETGFDSLDMRGSILTLTSRVITSIADDLPKTLVVGDSMSGQRTETPVIPVRVIREAIVNALMHRSYQVHRPVQVIRYSNRIVIRNPGYSLKSEDRFADPGSFIRNPNIAAILHETRFAETKGSGIRVMQEKMAQSGLASPAFESDRTADEFTATFLFHHFLDESDWGWLAGFKDLELTEDQMKALIFVREVQAIDNSTYRTLTHTDTLAASKSLRALTKLDLLVARGSGARTYYVAGPEMERRASSNVNNSGIAIQDNDHTLDGAIQDKGVAISDIPMPLRKAVANAGLKERLSPQEARTLITSLCAWRALSVAELASLLERSPVYLSQRYIGPLVSEGKLEYLYPEMIQHPGQKYRSVGGTANDNSE